MKKYTALFEEFQSMKLEEKCRFMKRHTGIPTTVSSESWSGVELRLTEDGDSAVFDAKHIRMNVNDQDLFEQILDTFNYVDDHVIEVVSKTWLDPSLKGGLGFMFALESDAEVKKIFARWRKYFAWIEKHYNTYDKYVWWRESSLPENLLAWASRAILGGVKPSEVGVSAIKAGLAEIDEYGILTYKKDKADKCVRYSVFDFSDDPSGKYDSFGYSGALSLDISKCFGRDTEPNMFRVSKIPEQWEIDRGFYRGCEPAKKSLLNRNKK